MEHVIEKLLENFEKGKMNRRQLVRSLAVAASAASVGGSVEAFAAEGPLPVTKLDHLSYTVANYSKTRDFYTGLLGMKVLEDDGKKQVRLSTGNTVLVARNASAGKPTGLIDHIGYATSVKDKDTLFAEIKRRGYNPEPLVAREGGVHIKDPDGYNVQLNPKK